MAADLLDLAKRLGVLKPCGDHVQPCPDWCGRSDGVLPTEAEAREALFDAGVTWVEIGASRGFAYVMFGGDEEHRAEASSEEADPDDLPLLTLLRALESRRG